MRRFLVLFLATFGLLVTWVSDATASLKKYDSRYSFVNHFADLSPKASKNQIPNEARVLINESGANPVLVKLLIKAASKSTAVIPGLSGFLFFSQASSEGPTPNQTGTGSTASSIDWGNVTGWTTSGGTWCQSVPSYVCGLASASHLDTIAVALHSTNYDMGTWVFHGTGFTAPGGYINRTGTADLGNSQYYVRGVGNPDGTVPALPLLGLGVTGLSVIALSVAASRRR